MNTTGGSAALAPSRPHPADVAATSAETPPQPVDARAADRANLRARILSAAVLGPLVLAVVWYGGWALTIALLAAAALAAGEWAAMLGRGDRRPVIAAAAVGAVAVCAFSIVASPWFLTAAAPIGLGLAAMVPAERRGLAFVGVPYLTFGLVAIAHLAVVGDGRVSIIFLLSVVWATDIGAYAAGRTIGGPKLAPRVSPKKTWAGLIGGMAAAAAAGAAVASCDGADSGVGAGLLGAGMAVVAQGGDLFESFVKRRVDVKDSGRLIPGHGGLLDRIDGLLAAAPVLALVEASGARPW